MSRLGQVVRVAIALSIASATSGAQTSVTVAAGASAPTGAFSNFHDVGYHILAAVGVNPPLSPVGFRLDGSFAEFNRTGAGTDAKDRVFAITGNGVLRISGGLGPYAIGGIGLYNIRRPSGVNDSGEIGFNIGGGYRFPLTGFSAFAEARYHRAGDGVAFVPITFGITF